MDCEMPLITTKRPNKMKKRRIKFYLEKVNSCITKRDELVIESYNILTALYELFKIRPDISHKNISWVIICIP